MSDVVLDASALLALLQKEPGAEVVLASLDQSCISTVNYAEVLSKLIDNGVPLHEAVAILESLPVVLRDHDEKHAIMNAALREPTKSRGLSLGDRACLALGKLTGLPVLTTETRWDNLTIDVEIRRIR
jgi:PIN domain nuclease of toxin-antitoxin system